jgi:D-3-phosphoglycerate dehydrogenase
MSDQRLSLPKDRIPVLLLEGVNDSAVELLQAAGYTNLERLPKALDPEDLKHRLAGGVRILGIRSRTELTENVLAAANRLIAVGCFSVGTNQVDLPAASRRGIPVFNAPFSNTRSVAELVIGEIVMLMRRVLPRSAAAHEGRWDKSAANSHEVRGKTLGIVGYGNIGSQLSSLAEAMGMKVVFYDATDKLRRGNTEPVETLDELLAVSDVVSLHVPETPATHGMIGEREIRAMKRGAYLTQQCARHGCRTSTRPRGRLRDRHLRARGRLRRVPGRATSNNERFVVHAAGARNVILTHVGGSSRGGQGAHRRGGRAQLVEYSDGGLDGRGA